MNYLTKTKWDQINRMFWQRMKHLSPRIIELVVTVGGGGAQIPCHSVDHSQLSSVFSPVYTTWHFTASMVVSAPSCFLPGSFK
jgi:hypothetical protein